MRSYLTKLLKKPNPDRYVTDGPDPMPSAPDGPDVAGYLDVVRLMVILLREFSLDAKEIDASGFRNDLEKMTREILDHHRDRGILPIFNRFKGNFLSFITRQKEYILVRENELGEIIDLLTQALATFDTENRVYNQTVYEQSEKIEDLAHLDDIRKIKVALQEEVSLMRRTIARKQARDQDRVEALSSQVQSLNSELEKTRAESLSDGLTGAYNRRAFDWELLGLVERNRILHRPFALLILDIDDFKKINDTHGHPVGDRVLVTLVHKCREFIREEDFFARYGGEEFALILPGARLKHAVRKGRLICKAIAAARYAADTDNPRAALRVTVSIGVSSFSQGDDAESLTRRADRALYQAKHNGKNRVVSEKAVG
jgi:diguanylate cyclase